MARKAKSHTMIKDPLLEPYFVTIDDNCCTVNQTIQKDSNHFRSNKSILFYVLGECTDSLKNGITSSSLKNLKKKSHTACTSIDFVLTFIVLIR